MSTLAKVAGGMSVTGAHRIIANLILSPAAGTAVFRVKVPRNAASGNNSISATVIRDLPDGTQQFSSVSINAPTLADIPFPLGVFTGRDGSFWTVPDDVGMWRVLVVSIVSSDGLGTGEVWHIDLCVNVPADGVTNFNVTAVAPLATVTSVDVTPSAS